MTRRSRLRATLFVGLGSLTLFLVALVIWHRPLVENWYLYRLQSSDREVRLMAAHWLGTLHSQRAVERLEEQFREEYRDATRHVALGGVDAADLSTAELLDRLYEAMTGEPWISTREYEISDLVAVSLNAGQAVVLSIDFDQYFSESPIEPKFACAPKGRAGSILLFDSADRFLSGFARGEVLKYYGIDVEPAVALGVSLSEGRLVVTHGRSFHEHIESALEALRSSPAYKELRRQLSRAETESSEDTEKSP